MEKAANEAENATKLLAAEENFQQSKLVAEQVLAGLLPEVREKLLVHYGIEALVNRIKDCKALQKRRAAGEDIEEEKEEEEEKTEENKDQKKVARLLGTKEEELQLWQTFVHAVVASCVASCYVLTLLNALIKVQVAMVSRHTQEDGGQDGKEAVVEGMGSDLTGRAEENEKKKTKKQTTEDTNRQFLAIVEWTISQGLGAFLLKVDEAVKATLACPPRPSSFPSSTAVQMWTLDTQITEQDWAHLMESIRGRLGPFASVPPLVSCLLPPFDDTVTSSSSAASSTASLKELQQELLFLSHSASFDVMVSLSLDAAFQLLAAHVFPPSTASPAIASSPSLAFVSLLVKASKLLSPVLLSSSTTEIALPIPTYVSVYEALQQVDEVAAFCSIVFFPFNPASPLPSASTSTSAADDVKAAERALSSALPSLASASSSAASISVSVKVSSSSTTSTVGQNRRAPTTATVEDYNSEEDDDKTEKKS